MLSYMVPSIEEKPPPVPSKSHLQLDLGAGGGEVVAQEAQAVQNRPPHQQPPQPALTNGHPTKRIIKTQSKTSTISADSSVSSLSSVVSEVPATHTSALTPSQDKPKHKVISNGAAKHPTLKRVSFGSSKGSMVETLIYESPLQEEPEPNTADQASVDSNQGSESGKASKVRVTFFECEKPLVVSSPEPTDCLDGLDAPFSMTSQSPPNPDQLPSYNRQASTDSGWDNPFRPDGDLSREADEIVEMIKGGKPITPTPGSTAPELPSVDENGVVSERTGLLGKTVAERQEASPPKGKKEPPVNGTPLTNGDGPAQVEPQRSTLLAPSDPSQVEHVTLKKKPKCKCCVIQ